MEADADVLLSVRAAFAETIGLKLQQLYRVVPKGTNPSLTGRFVEELVRGFIRDWISPCLLCDGTLYPHDASPSLPLEEQTPKQVDGIVYDPRLGPAIIREGAFLAVHPAFCRGIIEIKTSCDDMRAFEARLQGHFEQYLAPSTCSPFPSHHDVMGVVIHDPDPRGHSTPEWFSEVPLYHYRVCGHCPVFILFKKAGEDYEPYEPAIDAMIRAVFRSEWQHGRREDKLGPTLIMDP